MRMHLNGKKHLAREKQHILSMMKRNTENQGMIKVLHVNHELDYVLRFWNILCLYFVDKEENYAEEAEKQEDGMLSNCVMSMNISLNK